MYIYPFSKRLQFETIMKCVHLLFNFSYKVSLFDEKTKGIYIFYVYFQIATFLKASVYICIYIYIYVYNLIYVCLYFLVSGVLTLSFTKYSHNLISASYRSHKQCVKDQKNTNERTL